MRAAVLHTPGRPPSYGEHPAPAAASGSTVVRVTAAPVVPLDLLCASGTSYFGVPQTPYVPGGQGVGVVESSASVDAGTRVWFFATAGMKPGDGSLADVCAVPDADVVPIDAGVPDELAAAIGLSGIAAWMALSWRARLQPGERVLILGAGGAVGQVGVGVARVLGASTVVAMARPQSVARATAAGADVVVPLEGEVDAVAAALAEHGPFDVVLDPVFGVSSTAASRNLAEHGRLVNLGGAGGDQATYLVRRPPQPHRLRARLHQQRAHFRPAPRGDHRRPPPRGGGTGADAVRRASARGRRAGLVADRSR